MLEEPVYRGILGIDIERFSRTEWTDPTRARLRGRLHRLVDDALTAAKIDPSLTVRSDSGDGLWLLVGAEVSTVRLLHPLATGLAGALAVNNQQAPKPQRMRLRAVVHAGELLEDPHGHTGASLNLAARLLDAEASRAVLARNPDAAMVLLVSDEVYEGVVRHGYEGTDPAAWQPIRIHAKQTATRAWVQLPGLATQPPLPAVLVASSLGPASLLVPRELPCAPADFTGRGGELAALQALLRRPAPPAGTVVVSAIDGMAGVGKSALAIQAAHQLADHYPDGQLYVNLQATSPGLAPLDPLDALGRMLRALGLEPAAIPTEVEEAAARFRSLSAGRRLLIVLDNAASSSQVRPLLPGSPGCGVLVTSRQALAGLEGAQSVHVDVLPHNQALELLGRIAGPDRIAADPHSAAEVVRLCGRLPLALRIAGARLATRPHWPVRELATRLADATRRLEELAVEELAVRASFRVSVHTLQERRDPGDRAAEWSPLSLPDGSDLSPAAAARLLDLPESATERLLERLVNAQLLETPRPGRYRFHDLVRLYARDHAVREHPEARRLAALTRLFGFYTATAWHTLALLLPGNPRLASADPQWTTDGLRFPDAPAALEWLETERPNLLAAVTQAAATPRIAAGALLGFLIVRSYPNDAVRANQIVLELARRNHDRVTEAHAQNDLGVAYRRLGQYTEAANRNQDSLDLFRRLGSRLDQAAALNNLGLAFERLGRYADALTHLDHGLAIFQELGDPWGQAHSLNSLGLVYTRLGRHAEALRCLQDRSLLGQLGDAWGTAMNLNNLGVVYQRLGQHAQAIACHQESLAIYREFGGPQGQVEVLCHLGDALSAVGRHQQATAAWEEALAICESLELPETDDMRRKLSSAQPST